MTASTSQQRGAYWVRIITEAARLAAGNFGAPPMDAYQRLTQKRVSHTGRVVDALLPVLSRVCRVDLNALRTPQHRCFQCGDVAGLELWFVTETGIVEESVCACAPHAFDIQCAWFLLALPMLVYHSVRTRRAWVDSGPRTAHHLRDCARNAITAAHRLGVQVPGDKPADATVRDARV